LRDGAPQSAVGNYWGSFGICCSSALRIRSSLLARSNKAFVWLSRISRQNFERLLSPISLAARSILAKSRVCIEIQTRSVLLSWGSRGCDIGSGSFGNGLTFVQLFSKIRCIIVPHNGFVKGISAVAGAHSPRNHAPHQAPSAHPGTSKCQNAFFASVGDEYARRDTHRRQAFGWAPGPQVVREIPG